jgi:hypothetical protein
MADWLEYGYQKGTVSHDDRATNRVTDGRLSTKTPCGLSGSATGRRVERHRTTTQRLP